MTKDKWRIHLECSRCGQELIASPGMGLYALAGKGVCVRCGGEFVLPDVPVPKQERSDDE